MPRVTARIRMPLRPSFSSAKCRRIDSARIQSTSTTKIGSQVIRFGIWMSDFQLCWAPSLDSDTPEGVPRITNSLCQ